MQTICPTCTLYTQAFSTSQFSHFRSYFLYNSGNTLLKSSKSYALTYTYPQLIFIIIQILSPRLILSYNQHLPTICTSFLKSQRRNALLLHLKYFLASANDVDWKILWDEYIVIMLRRVCWMAAFSKVKILRSTSNNIHFNLATEEYLFEEAQLTLPTLFLWQNSPTIVIGRHQNPWKECRNEEMKAQGVLLSRRKTGGGAVYHDLGNTCFSFLTPYNQGQDYDYKTVNNQILVAAFRDLGVEAEVAGRNDIHCSGKKISGSAYRLFLGGKDGKGRKALHHGTVLFSVDLQALQKYLNPNKKKLESKGVTSVISRVMNLTETYPHLAHDVFCKALETAFQRHYGGPVERQVLESEQLRKENAIINGNYQRLRSWDWLYGQCPEFKYSIDHKFDWGMTEVTYNVQDGLIKEGKVYSDCLFPDFIEIANEELNRGVRYDSEGLAILESRIKERIGEEWFKMAEQLCRWMVGEL